eukprot:2899620-Rhodomonas_salina.2
MSRRGKPGHVTAGEVTAARVWLDAMRREGGKACAEGLGHGGWQQTWRERRSVLRGCLSPLHTPQPPRAKSVPGCDRPSTVPGHCCMLRRGCRRGELRGVLRTVAGLGPDRREARGASSGGGARGGGGLGGGGDARGGGGADERRGSGAEGREGAGGDLELELVDDSVGEPV